MNKRKYSKLNDSLECVATSPNLSLWWQFFAITWFLLLLLGVGFLVLRFADDTHAEKNNLLIDTDLLAILPRYQDNTLKEILDTIDTDRNRQLLLAISFAQNNDKNQTVIDSGPLLVNLSKQLKQSGLFEFSDNDQKIKNTIILSKTLWKHRQQLLSHEDSILLQKNGAASVVEKALAKVYGFNQLNKKMLHGDSLFLFQQYLESMMPSRMRDFTLRGNWLSKIQLNKVYYLQPLKLKESAFDTNYQQEVKQLLAQLKTTVTNKKGTLLSVGAVVFAEQGFSQSKKEMSTVGLGGLFGIVLLLIFVFRSITPLLTLLFSLGLSLAFSLNIALWWFGSLHIFALLFSAAIIGISIDYGFHFLVNVYESNEKYSNHQRRISSVKQILPSLTIGMLSSVLAYALFAWGGFTVLSQVAVLALIGLPSMYLTVILILPFAPFPKLLKPLPIKLKLLTDYLANNHVVCFLKYYLRNPVILLALLFCVGFSVWIIKPNDDIRSLQSLSKQSLADELLLRKLFNHPYASTYNVLVSHDLGLLLTAEAEFIKHNPRKFVNQLPINTILPNRKKQLVNYQAYQSLYLSPEVSNYQQNLGDAVNFQMEVFSPINIESVLRLETLKARLSNRLIELSDSRWALLMPIQEEAIVDELPIVKTPVSLQTNQVKIYNINPTADMSAQFKSFREQLIIWILVAILSLLLLGVIRYGARGIIIVLLPVVTALLSLLVTALLGFDISLFSALAVLLLLGMGLDYVIFLAETQYPEKVMVSLFLSCVTTILSFGLLALSQTIAVATFGITVTIGMMLILLLSPSVVRTKNEKN